MTLATPRDTDGTLNTSGFNGSCWQDVATRENDMRNSLMGLMVKYIEAKGGANILNARVITEGLGSKSHTARRVREEWHRATGMFEAFLWIAERDYGVEGEEWARHWILSVDSSLMIYREGHGVMPETYEYERPDAPIE